MFVKTLQLAGFVLLGMMVTVAACKHEIPVLPGKPPADTGNPDRNCSADTIYFEEQVLPILQSNCAFGGCHDVASAQDGVILNNYDNTFSTTEVRPFNARGSKIYEVITDADPRDRMPLDRAPLTDVQIELIRKWIDQGALNLRCKSCTDTVNVRYSVQIRAIVQNKCQGCHSGASPAGGLDYTTHAGLQAVALNGKLYGAVSHASGFVPMPFNGSKLPLCQLVQIKKWADAGAPNN
jgi:uncharacterized membrane protein